MSDLPDPPYPATVRAKGWRFELDYEQIEQSSTWALASAKAPEVRGWLLLMWMCAWKQVPCGSFPNDEAVIAAMIGMPSKTWTRLRDVLMRGWTASSDGRVYHDTIGARVAEMLEYRAKAAKRVADFKEKKRLERNGNALPKRELRDKNDTGTGTGTTDSEAKASGTSAPPPAPPPADPPITGRRKPTDEESELWRQGKAMFVAKEAAKGVKEAGVLLGALAKKYGNDVFREALRALLEAAPGEPHTYLVALCEKAAGKRVPLNRQEATETGNRSVADSWEQERAAA